MLEAVEISAKEIQAAQEAALNKWTKAVRTEAIGECQRKAANLYAELKAIPDTPPATLLGVSLVENALNLVKPSQISTGRK